jgi:hypothetical protein
MTRRAAVLASLLGSAIVACSTVQPAPSPQLSAAALECHADLAPTLAVVSIAHARDVTQTVRHLDAAPELNVDAPATVVVFRDGIRLRPGAPIMTWPPDVPPCRRAVCVKIDGEAGIDVYGVEPGTPY